MEENLSNLLVIDFVFVAFFAHLICLAVATLVVKNNLSNSVVIDFVFVVDFVLFVDFVFVFAHLICLATLAMRDNLSNNVVATRVVQTAVELVHRVLIVLTSNLVC